MDEHPEYEKLQERYEKEITLQKRLCDQHDASVCRLRQQSGNTPASAALKASSVAGSIIESIVEEEDSGEEMC